LALHGSIEEAGLPGVLQLLALGGKTGCIAVERSPVHGAIYLEAGVVVWAEIVSRGDRLGDHLVRSGKITREQLRQAIETLTHNASLTLAEVLITSETISRGQLDRYVQHQVEEAIFLMCSWTDGRFNFNANARPPRHAVPVALMAQSLLLEAGRRADEWLVIQQAIPSFDRIYRRAGLRPGAAPPELTSDQHRILPLLDGTRDVNGLIELSGLSTFEVAKALLELIMAGGVQLQERRPSTSHFDEGELRAYAFKQGEYADAERRKDAARHIADCQMCGSRLREFHLRRTSQATPPADTRGLTTGTQAAQMPRPTPPVQGVTAAAKPPVLPERPRPPAPRPLVPTPPAPLPPTPPSSRLSKDIVWLTSPQEADEIRRSEQRPVAPASSPAAKPPAPKPPVPAAAVKAPAPIAPAPPPAPAALPAPAAAKPAQKTAARMIAVPPPKPAAVPKPVPGSEAVPPADAPRGIKWKIPAIAGGSLVVLAGGFLAFRHFSTGRTPAVQTAAITPAPVPPAPAIVAPTPAATDSVRHDSVAPLPRDTQVTGAAPSSSDTPVARAARPVSAPATAPVMAPIERPTPAPATPAPTSTPAAVEPAGPDAELASGGWRVIDRAEATSALGGRIAMIPGLRAESFASSEARGRTRVRVAQIARTGQRIVLIETANGAAPAGPARATAVSVEPPLEGTSESIGSASLGNLQITARSTLTPAALRPLLSRLAW